MPDSPVADALTARRDLVVLLRLVVEVGGRVIYGEVVDTRRPPRRFFGEQGLVAAIRGLRNGGTVGLPTTRPMAAGGSGRVPNKRRRLPVRSERCAVDGRRTAPPDEATDAR